MEMAGVLDVAGRQGWYSDGSCTEATSSVGMQCSGCPSVSCGGKNTSIQFCV